MASTSVFTPFPAPQHQPPPNCADDVELTTDPAIRRDVVVFVRDVHGPVHKSDGRTVVAAVPAFDREAACLMALLLVMFVILAVPIVAGFIEIVTRVTWMEELVVLPVGALALFMFLIMFTRCLAPLFEKYRG